MSRRIEVELTSSRPDGTWTWRAAGAKLPKGELDGALLYPGAKVGDVVRADADFLMDGIDIIGVLAPKGPRKEPERIEVIGRPVRDEDLVTTKLAAKGKPKKNDRRPRRERPADGATATTEKKERRPKAERRPRPTKPLPEKPKAKRLRAGRTHRNAVLSSLPEEQKPIAEQVLKGGIPAVRLAVEKQNEENKAAGKPEINPTPLLALAEQLMPALKLAEWQDKAEAALAGQSDVDLRDLRSVVVAADANARTDETRELAEQLRQALNTRIESEQIAWVNELRELLEGNRPVRALRVSSRPPKAGAPLPADLDAALCTAAIDSLTADTPSDRYATVLDALAYSPVRNKVTPKGKPAEPSEELIATVTKLASRLPQVASLFGIEGKPKKPAKPSAPAAPETATEPATEPAPQAVPETATTTEEPTEVLEA